MIKYDYKIEHIPGVKNKIADTLSRINSIENDKLSDINFFQPLVDIE